MTDDIDNVFSQLRSLGFTGAEADIYLALLAQPQTVLQLSRATSIARTTVYRALEQLEQRSLVTRQTDENGTHFSATDPTTLEIAVATQEDELRRQHDVVRKLVPALTELQQTQQPATDFAVRVYEGEEGFKQMCWHDLKTKGELLSIGADSVEDLLPNHHRAEKYRELTVRAGFKVRELINSDERPTFTSNSEYMESIYRTRAISNLRLPTNLETTIYNDTVAIYSLNPHKKVGVEIVSPAFADFMRGIFDAYWKQGRPVSPS